MEEKKSQYDSLAIRYSFYERGFLHPPVIHANGKYSDDSNRSERTFVELIVTSQLKNDAKLTPVFVSVYSLDSMENLAKDP